jgi:iron complex outermembrane receptor protein
VGSLAAELGAFVNVKTLFHPIFQVVDQRSTDDGAFARMRWHSGPMQLTVGITARFGTMESSRFVNVSGQRGAVTFDANLKGRTIDLYGEGRYSLGEVSLIVGGIYTLALREQDQIFPTAVQARASYDQLSPKFGMLFEPRANLQFFLSYSRSHELPGFIELAQVASFVPLSAQRAWTAEAGLRGKLGIARFDLSLYRARLDGEMLQFSLGPTIPAATFNAKRTLHQGVEAGLDLDLASWARLRQVYQLNAFRFRDDAQFGDNRLPVIPRHLYRAELRLGSERLNVAPSLEWIPTGAWADYANGFKVPGYVSLGLTAEAQVRPGVTVFLDARNIANAQAIGDLSAVVDYRTLLPFQKAIFSPIERRSLYAGVRAQF